MKTANGIEVRKGWKSGSGDDKTILVVKDRLVDHDLLVDMLGDDGYGIIAVGEPEAALQVLGVVKVNMVALDLSILMENHCAVLKRLQRLEHAADTPVMIFSWGDGDFPAVDLVTAMRKPLDPAEVIQKVESFIGKP